MRRFRYGRDPLGLAACAAYAVLRWVAPAGWPGGFTRGHLADTLLIPAALPWLLGCQRWWGLRPHDAPPPWGEIALVWAVWAFAAEVVAPRLFARATGDVWDVVAYAVGGLAAGWWWHRP